MMGSCACQPLLRVEVFLNGGVFIRQNFPDFWANNVESHLGLEVRLIKLSKDSVGIIWFKLSVKILFLVNINKAAATTTIVIVCIPILDGNMIFTLLKFRDVQQNISLFVV